MNQRLQIGRLDVGNALSNTFSIYGDQAGVLLPSAAILYLGVFVIDVILLLALGLTAGALVAGLVDLIATTFFVGMVVNLVGDVQDGRRDATPGRLLRAAAPYVLPLIGLGIIYWICVVVGLVLIIVPGLIIATIWCVSPAILLLERRGVFDSLSRSWELVRGNAWAVFGVLIVLLLILLVVGAIGSGISNGADSAVVTAIVRLIVNVITAPLLALGISVLYFQLLAAHGAGAAPPAAGPPPGAAPPPPPGPESPGGQPPPPPRAG